MAITVNLLTNYILIKCPAATFAEDEAKACTEALRGVPEARSLLVLDLSEAQEITIGALRLLIRVASSMEQENSKVAMVCNKKVSKTVMEQGMERLFQCYPTLDEVIRPIKSESSKGSALEFLNTVLECLAYTFKTVTNTEVNAGKSYVRAGNQSHDIEIAAVAPIFSSAFNGALIIGFPQKTYLGIMSRMLEQNFTEITPIMRDGAAELLNIIIGQAKSKLNEKGFALRQTIPTIVEGTNLRIQTSTQRPSVIVPYTSELGPFYIEVTTTPESVTG